VGAVDVEVGFVCFFLFLICYATLCYELGRLALVWFSWGWGGGLLGLIGPGGSLTLGAVHEGVFVLMHKEM
jgi:hypothetical protein